MVFGDVAVSHPTSGVGDVEQDVEDLACFHKGRVRPDQVRILDTVAAEHEESTGTVNVERSPGDSAPGPPRAAGIVVGMYFGDYPPPRHGRASHELRELMYVRALGLEGRQVMSARFLVVAVMGASVVAMLPAQVWAGTVGKWSRVTDPSGRNIDQVAHARTADGTLHTAWVLAAPGSDSLFHTPIASNGAVGQTTPIQSGWATINPVPDLVLTPDGGLRVFFGGIRSTSPDETNDELNTATAPAAGSPWTLMQGNVTAGGAGAYGGDTGAAVLPDGTPLESWGGTGFGVFVHRGLSPSSPNYAYQSQLGGCCGYSPDLAVESTSGAAVIAWYSNASGNLGVYVQAVDGATGAPVGAPFRMPGSVTNFNGTPSSSQMLARTPITARPGQPGVFVAYPGGYPTTNRVLVWRVGGEVDVVARKASNHIVGITAAPDGRLWVVWARQDAPPRVFARRSNPAATEWGPPVSAGAPAGASSIYKIDGDAQAGGLDVLGLFSTPGGEATWHTQLRPGLALEADPARLRRHSGNRVVFTVTEPNPVAGATVKAAGESGTTNKKGKVELQLGQFGENKKKVKATATKPGYSPGSLRLRIRR